MSLPRYGEYKNSGVRWLGEMPAHWSLQRYKQVFREREERSEAGQETLLSVSAYTGVSPRSEIVDDGDYLSRAESLEGYKVCYPNDLVMNIMLAWNRGLGFSAHHGIVSPAYSVFVPQEGNLPRFLDYMVRSDQVILYYKAFSSGVIDSRLRLYPDTFGSLYCMLPPLSEQTTIAAFLDRETAKIDALIAEQERLIALLAEKRQATISHTVTKGLDPKAPMKDSGVAWLGQVPAHWDMKRVKDCGCDVVDCKNRTPEPHDDGDYFVVRTSCVKDGQFNPVPGYRTDEANFIEWTAKGRPRAGDVLFTREAPTGEACLAPEELDFCLGQRMMYIRPLKEVLLSEFLLYSIYGGLARERISEKSKGSTVGHLRVGEVGELPLLLPPLDEQQVLVQFLAEELSKLQILAATAERAIALMKERRSALIAAAVTGQIDVRNA